MLHARVRCCLAPLVWALLLAPPAAATADEIVIRRVFGPEVPGEYKHPSSITELDNGDLYLVYYGGSGEYGTDTAVWGARKPRGSDEWTMPQVIADTPFHTDGNAVIWQGPDERVWLFYVTTYGETWSSSRINGRFSADGARTWSDPFMMTFEPGTMVRSHPIVLADGDWLLPIYHETGEDREWVGPESTSLFLRCDPRTQRWTEMGRIRSAKGNIQPAVVEVRPGYLVAYCRRGGDYEPTTEGYLIRAQSHDGGRTWSEGRNSEFLNPNSAVDFIKLANGHLLLVYNDSMNDRTPLTVAISTDGDQSYPHRRNLKEGRGSFAYPTAIQAADGRIHVVFTSDQRTVVNHAVFDEAAILSHAVR